MFFFVIKIMCSEGYPPAGIGVKPNTQGFRPIKCVENHFKKTLNKTWGNTNSFFTFLPY